MAWALWGSVWGWLQLYHFPDYSVCVYVLLICSSCPRYTLMHIKTYRPIIQLNHEISLLGALWLKWQHLRCVLQMNPSDLVSFWITNACPGQLKMSSCKYQKCLMLSVKLRAVWILREVLKSEFVKPMHFQIITNHSPSEMFPVIDRILPNTLIWPETPSCVTAVTPKNTSVNLCLFYCKKWRKSDFFSWNEGFKLTA